MFAQIFRKVLLTEIAKTDGPKNAGGEIPVKNFYYGQYLLFHLLPGLFLLIAPPFLQFPSRHPFSVLSPLPIFPRRPIPMGSEQRCKLPLVRVERDRQTTFVTFQSEKCFQREQFLASTDNCINKKINV